jgi:hypothetical protein
MVGHNPLKQRIELRRTQPLHRRTLRPDLKNIGGALGFGAVPYRRADNPNRREAAGIVVVHGPSALLEMERLVTVYEDERSGYGSATFARHVLALETAPAGGAGTLSAKSQRAMSSARAQTLFRMRISREHHRRHGDCANPSALF